MSEPDFPPVPLWDLVQTAHLATRRFTEVFAEAGLTPAQFGVLACVADGDDLSQADLARAVFVRPQSVSRLIGAMADQGLVARTGRGGRLGRGLRATLVLTEAGRRALDIARPAAYALNEPIALGLTDDQMGDLLTTLTTIRASLQRGVGPSEPDADLES